MKKNALLSLIVLGSLNAAAHATPQKIPPLPDAIQKQIHQRLTLGSLPEQVTSSLNNTSLLPHASGHMFYDYAVTLKDDTGAKIRFTDERKHQKNYTVDRIASKEMISHNIWFFSPNGTDLPESVNNPEDYCTFEHPCRNVTQDLIDKIHQTGVIADFWFATGQYEMPVNAQQYDSKVLFLYNRSTVRGRSSDFRFNPTANERPVIEGTLAWNDWEFHHGGTGYVKHIKSHTIDNPVDLMDGPQSVNLYSNGWLELEKTDIIQDPAAIEANNNRSSNILAEKVYVFDSNLSNKGLFAINISAQTVISNASSLTADGPYTNNIYPGSATDTTFYETHYIYLHRSNLTLKNACRSNMIETSEVSNVIIRYSRLEATSSDATECSLSALSSGSAQLKFRNEIVNSKISITTLQGKAFGFFGDNQDFLIVNSQITLDARNGYASIMYAKSVTLAGEPSSFSVQSGESDPKLWRVEHFLNESISPSQCTVNDNEAQDCKI